MAKKEKYRRMQIRKVVVVYMKDPSHEHGQTMAQVRKCLGNYNAIYILRKKLSKKIFSGADLAVVVGGDGTFLRTAQHVTGHQLLLGVNSNPRHKEGFFMCCTKKDFKKKLASVASGKFRSLSMPRLESYLGAQKLPLALNEVFIGDIKPYRMSYYELKIGNYSEFQRSSGLLVSTPQGSHAWIKSAGGRAMQMNKYEYQIHSSEPYFRTLNKQKITNKVLASGKTLEVTSDMRKGIVVIDSVPREYKFGYGKTIRIKLSHNFLHVVR